MKKTSESAKPSPKTTSETSTDVKDYFQLGNYVKFIDLLGHDSEGWGVDAIEFKIIKAHLGQSGQIIDIHTDPSVPDEYNAQKVRYLYRVKYLEPYAKGKSEELLRFIPADNVQDAILTAGIKHKVGNFYGSPILEVVVDKEFY